jgi:hypothetical protein
VAAVAGAVDAHKRSFFLSACLVCLPAAHHTGAFFLAYALGQIPSNFLLLR